jgi:hypothetical protein
VAVYATLTKIADQTRAAGDERSRGQVMADELVARITGHDRASDVPVTVNLVMDPETLFGAADQPAHVDGYGPIPAATARRLVRDTSAAAWVRRLFIRPGAGSLAAVDARRREFSPALRDLLTFRDRTCRTPWCDALIRHADHVVDHTADHRETRAGSKTTTNGSSPRQGPRGCLPD